jgi:hypothetical protein
MNFYGINDKLLPHRHGHAGAGREAHGLGNATMLAEQAQGLGRVIVCLRFGASGSPMVMQLVDHGKGRVADGTGVDTLSFMMAPGVSAYVMSDRGQGRIDYAGGGFKYGAHLEHGTHTRSSSGSSELFGTYMFNVSGF